MCHVSQTHLPIYSSTPLFLQTPHNSTQHPFSSSSFSSQFQSRPPPTTLIVMNRIQKKKKQSIGKRVPCFWDDYDDGDDMVDVAEILIQLPELILHAKPSSSLVWGAKRRRSAISGAAGTKSVVVVSAAATSPATPLMFSPSESDDKANNNNNNTPSRASPISKRKNKEELMQSVTDLTHQKQSLVKEMEAAKRHLDALRASNLELKHRKQVMIYGFSQPSLQTIQQQQQQQIRYPFQMQHPSIQWNTLSSVPAVNKMGPEGLPDLNLTLEEAASNVDGLVGVGIGGGYQASDVMMVMDYNVNSRALASAQARKRRMQIYKEKSQNQVLRQR